MVIEISLFQVVKNWGLHEKQLVSQLETKTDTQCAALLSPLLFICLPPFFFF